MTIGDALICLGFFLMGVSCVGLIFTLFQVYHSWKKLKAWDRDMDAQMEKLRLDVRHSTFAGFNYEQLIDLQTVLMCQQLTLDELINNLKKADYVHPSTANKA